MKPDEIDYDNLTFSFTETKSMYVFDKKFSKQTLQNLRKYKYKGMSAVYNHNKNKKSKADGCR